MSRSHKQKFQYNVTLLVEKITIPKTSVRKLTRKILFKILARWIEQMSSAYCAESTFPMFKLIMIWQNT